MTVASGTESPVFSPLARNGPLASLNLHQRTIFFLVIIGSVALTGRLCEVFRPFSTDGAMFIYMGKLVSQGGRVGCEMIDNKFPTVGLMTSGAWRMFGGHWVDYVLLQTVMVLLAAALLARAAYRSIGPHAALPAGLFCLVFLNFRFAVDGGFQLETMQAFFEIMAACAALPALLDDDARDSFVVGLAAGTAALFKPSGLAVLAAFALAMILRQRGSSRLVRHGVASAAGLAIPVGVALIYFVGAGLLGQIPEIWRQIGRYASHSLWEPWDLGKGVVVIAIAGFPMLVRGAIFRHPRDRSSEPVDRAALAFALLWLGAEMAAVIGQRRMYPYHFLILVPPLALVFAMIPRGDRLFPLVAALLLPLMLSCYGTWLVLTHANSPTQRLAASDYLTAHARPNELVWQDSMPRLLIETGLSPGSRYQATFIWANDEQAPQEYCAGLLKDLDERKPEFILLPTQVDLRVAKVSSELKELRLSPRRRTNYARAWSDLRDYVEEHYVPVSQVGRETVWRRMNGPTKARSLPAKGLVFGAAGNL